jgi:exodeoxyribonuclease VII large subunit
MSHPGFRAIWACGALCRAVADALDARFNPVAVRGEISGFTRAASGHCYFTLKDAEGAAALRDVQARGGLAGLLPRDGDLVELRGRLGVYEPRGDLQLIVESMQRGQPARCSSSSCGSRPGWRPKACSTAARKRGLPPTAARHGRGDLALARRRCATW